ncbi:MAG TPA: hypothetical protein VFZ81_06330 [Burkholderiales bacterium]|jgi:hypothetical protein
MSKACKIEYVTPAHNGRVAGFAGTDGDGRPWRLSRDELILAIETGAMTCYVTFEGHSHLVTLTRDAEGNKALVTFLGEIEALPLPASR